MKNRPVARPAPTTEQAAATAIHHPEQDETILARWLRHGMARGPKFWVLLGSVVVLAVVLALVVQGLAEGRSEQGDAWSDLILAQGPEDDLKAAEKGGPVAAWALLRAAEARYLEGFGNLPENRDAALPLLTKAYDLFEQAYEKSADDKAAPVRRFAALGMARALEARGDLEQAIKRYNEVARDWRDTDEAKQAAALAAELETPEIAKFYKDFAAFKPETMTLPPRGQGLLDLPGTHPPLDGPIVPAPGLDSPARKAIDDILDAPFPTPSSTTPPPAPTPLVPEPKGAAPK
jgi:tetratricopeptide (TPR) repeat protein